MRPLLAGEKPMTGGFEPKALKYEKGAKSPKTKWLKIRKSHFFFRKQ